MTDSEYEFDENWMTKDIEKQFIEVIKKVNKHIELKNDEAAMLFYWMRHRDELIFTKVNAAVGYGKANKPRRVYRNKKKDKS